MPETTQVKPRCRVCNSANQTGCRVIDNVHYCRNCTRTCGSCRARKPINQLKTVLFAQGNGKEIALCPHCIVHLKLRECVKCNLPTTLAVRSQEQPDGTYCIKCLTEVVPKCSCCRQFKLSAKDNIQNVCKSCRAIDLNSYSLKPEPCFRSVEGDNKLFMGIEIEVQLNTVNPEKWMGVVKGIRKELGLDFYIKRDSSILNGVEIVSHPMTLDYWENNDFGKKLNAFVKAGDIKGYSAEGCFCGIHIHLSKSAFTAPELFKWLKFHNENQKFITAMGQRKTNQYCRFEYPEKPKRYEKKDFLYMSKHKVSCTGNRRVAVNLNPSKTIEMRYFQTNLKPSRIIKNLQFIEALYFFIKETPVFAVNLKNFEDWLSDKERYNILKEYIALTKENKILLTGD